MKIKTILLLLSLFAFINGTVYTLTKIGTEHKVELVLEQNKKILQTNYNILLESQKHISYSLYKSILRNTDVVKLLENSYNQSEDIKSKNREKLYSQIKDEYKVSKTLGVLQVQFVFKDSVSFLRVHKPSKFGDDLTGVREDFRYTNKTQKPISKFVQGRVSHGFRNVFPIFNKENIYLGAVEISFSSEKFQWYLNNITQIHTHFLVNKDIFKAKVWERDDKNIGYKESFESKEYMIYTNNIPNYKRILNKNKGKLKSIKNEIEESISLGEPFSSYIKYEDEVEVISFLPISDLSNNTIAWLVSYNKSEIIKEALLNQFVFRIITLFISILIIFFLVKEILSKEELDKQKVLVYDILNNTDDIMIVTDFKDIKYSNYKFRDLIDIHSSTKFNKLYDHSFINLFLTMKGYLNKELLKNNESFLSLFERTQKRDRVVAILDKHIEIKAFNINISKSQNDGDYILLLSDITKLKEYQVKTEQKAYIDGLTQVYNRNKFDELLTTELKNSKRYKNSLSIAIIDIDKFKNFNDKYGHLIGDEVLVKMAQTVDRSIRETDVFARWGGEEFVILFRNTKIKDALTASNNIRKKIENNKHTIAGKITASFGLTQYIEDDSIETILKRCDDALYRAKENGRNRVEVF
ncbi:MAG: diguanylate cyclase [Campylobacterota bacterium]|nr:diguanylate cyclase [Campylobacterota bacterium]